MKYKAIIFDLFGTLVENFSRAEYEKTLEEMTDVLGAPKDAFVRRWVSTFTQRSTGVFPGAGDCVRYICRELKVPATEAQVQRAGRIRLDYTLKNMKPRTGALEVLAALKSKEYKIGLISDCTPETPLVWQDTPFAPFFDVTVFSCRAGIKKPDPRIYKMATDALDVSPRDCLYIGDGSSREISGAAAIGIRAVLIRDPEEVADAHTIDREEWPGEAIAYLGEILALLE